MCGVPGMKLDIWMSKGLVSGLYCIWFSSFSFRTKLSSNICSFLAILMSICYCSTSGSKELLMGRMKVFNEF